MLGSKFTALFQKSIKHIAENISVSFGIGIALSALCNAGEPEMIPLPMVAPQADLNVSKAVQSLGLGKQQYYKLLPA